MSGGPRGIDVVLRFPGLPPPPVAVYLPRERRALIERHGWELWGWYPDAVLQSVAWASALPVLLTATGQRGRELFVPYRVGWTMRMRGQRSLPIAGHAYDALPFDIMQVAILCAMVERYGLPAVLLGLSEERAAADYYASFLGCAPKASAL